MLDSEIDLFDYLQIKKIFFSNLDAILLLEGTASNSPLY